MTHYDYKVIPAPRKLKRVKGVQRRRGAVRADADRGDQRGGAPGLGVCARRAAAGRGAARLAAAGGRRGAGGAGVPPRARVARAPARLGAPRVGGVAPAVALPPEPEAPRPSRRAGGGEPDEVALQRAEPSLSFDGADETRDAAAAARAARSLRAGSRLAAAPHSLPDLAEQSAPRPGRRAPITSRRRCPGPLGLRLRSGPPDRAARHRRPLRAIRGTSRSATRSRQLQRQRVHAAGELVGERAVHGAAALDAAEAVEGRGPHHHAEVGLTALAPAGVAAVPLALVDHLEMFGPEGRPQLRLDACRRCRRSSRPFASPRGTGLGPRRQMPKLKRPSRPARPRTPPAHAPSRLSISTFPSPPTRSGARAGADSPARSRARSGSAIARAATGRASSARRARRTTSTTSAGSASTMCASTI